MSDPSPGMRRSADRGPQRVAYIGGASGTGTSTRAGQVQRELTAHPAARPCLVIATDVVRAQLRAVLDQSIHADLWGESFNVPEREGDTVRDGVNVSGFLRQCEPILRAVEAGVEYALTEGWNVAVEGVHLVPGLVVPPARNDVMVTAELLVVQHEDEHVRRFRSRDAASAGGRPAEHYQRNLPRIRAVQAELLSRLRSADGALDWEARY